MYSSITHIHTILTRLCRLNIENSLKEQSISEGGGVDDSTSESYEDNGLYGTFDPNESGSREEEGGSSRGGSREYGYGESAPPSTISLDGEDLGEREIESPSSRVAVIRF